MNKAPVLLLTFNRPDLTQQVFNAIRAYIPDRFYIFNDGPRKGNATDAKARKDIMEIISHIDWNCDVFRNFSETNQGCGIGVSGAISWAFEHEEKLIILEDDCIPSMNFFMFCNHCLDLYFDDEKIVQVAGNNYTEKHNFTADDYIIAKYGHIWGWATWKRAWAKFDYEMTEWPLVRNSSWLSATFADSAERDYFTEKFDLYYNDIRRPWAMRWFFARMRSGGLSLIPKINLVKNIGHIGTHSKMEFKYKVDLHAALTIRSEPAAVACNTRYDAYHFRYHINKKSLFYPLRQRMKRLVSLFKLK